jgi:hypothetical protein
MGTTPDPAPSTKTLFHTLLLAGAVFIIPVLIGILFVLVSHRLAPPAAAPAADAAGRLAGRLRDGSATNVAQLAALRRDLRNEGLPTDEADLRLWAARAAEPERLFRVPPPEPGKRWNWHLAQDGLHALAVSFQLDAAERRTVGLYDLVGEAWVWTNALPWPDTHETPYGRHTVVRYVKNAVRFALEVDEQGRIAGIDRLGAGLFAMPGPVPFSPHFPDLPAVAVKHDVFFTADPQDGALLGYANRPLPGLRHAGPCDAATAFSGNGLLKFSASPTGTVAVADSLTQTVLQHYKVWPADSATAVNGMTAAPDGSNLVVVLTSTFAGTPPVKRDWSMSIDLYSGRGKADTGPQPPRPERAAGLTALSPDGKWRFAVSAENELTVEAVDSAHGVPGGHAPPPAETAAQGSPRPPGAVVVARVALAPLGLRAPVRSIAFLEGGRHLAIRQDADVWLLDFAVARSYGDLTARVASCSRTISLESYRVRRETNGTEKADALLATAPEGHGVAEAFDSDTLSFAPDPEATAPSYLALRAELFAANQAWGYAAALLEETARLQEYDPRAPRVNPLLLARCQLLAGQHQKARSTCRDALRTLLARPATYDFATGTTRPSPNTDENDNRMVRYHLQGLLFAK